MVIYPVDNAIQSLNNQDLIEIFVPLCDPLEIFG